MSTELFTAAATKSPETVEFGEELRLATERIVSLALAEDTGTDPDDEYADLPAADVTSVALIPPGLPGKAAIVAKAEGVIAGLPAVAMVFEMVDPACRFHQLIPDGTIVRKRAVLAEVFGPYRSLLTAERTALNLLQHLSGVATQTRKFVTAVEESRAEILDTRKTLPGLRLLEKYAVRVGGGRNHRLGLHDMLLIKENHLVACGDDPAEGVRLARALGKKLPVEVEVTSLQEFDEALEVSPDIILLDNMTPEQMSEAVARREARFPKGRGPLLEASGGINLDNVSVVSKTGVERISVGALTHSAASLDICMDIGVVS